MTTMYAILQKNPNHIRDLEEECKRMWQWGFDPQAQAELRAEVGRALRRGARLFCVCLPIKVENPP